MPKEEIPSKKNRLKPIYWAAIILLALFIAIYVLFFKPNPIVRVNMNKLKAKENQKSALTLETPKEIDGVGKNFKVKVVVDTEGNYINSVQSYLSFDPKVLEVVSTSTEDSFCKFYPENNYSNDKGTIKLACGTPYPGFKGTNSVETIEFFAKAIKTTEIKILPQSLVLANDGKGTNLLRDFNTATIKIKAAL